ncbi:ArdC family protein [Bacillus spizizenii]|nr:ArdC family protein [Bacillus spizizenii]
MATNYQLIEEACMMINFDYDGTNLKTFNEWSNAGYIVKKGEKAFLTVDLWKPFVKKLTDKDGNPEIDEKTGKQKEEKRFMLKTSHLFTADQVEKGVLKKRTKKKTTAKKPTYKKKSA